MVTRHMAKMTHEEYLPRCRVPVITSLEEEQRIISTSAKVRGGEGREGVSEYKMPSYIFLDYCGSFIWLSGATHGVAQPGARQW